MLLHVVKETDAGIIVRGAKYETAAAYANQAFTKPTIANWGNRSSPTMRVGFIVRSRLARHEVHLPHRLRRAARPAEDYPLANRFDEVDTLVIFDDVLIPWENVLFYRHTKAAMFIRATLHRYCAFAFVQRNLKFADMMIGAALFNVRQTGLDKQQAVQEKLAELAVYREGINAHLTAAIALAETSPRRAADAQPVAALHRPRAGLLPAAAMMHIARELCGGQICVTPDKAAFEHPEAGRGWRSSTRSTRTGWRRTGASCWPSRATC